MTNLRRISILYWWAWLGWWTEATLAHSREGFFNSTSYVSLYNPLLLSRHIGLSFRTCKGGQLFAQTQRSSFIQTISLDVRPEGLVFTVLTLKQKYESRISLKLLDNEWHTVNILYRMGNLTISTSGYQQVIANSTYNSEILSHPEVISNNDVLVVGKGFVGCILEGPSIVFNTSQMQFYNVEWGPCPLPNRACELVDHCSNEPCMRHGRCIRLPDRYLCQCTARYSGSNCQIDNGPPCEKFPCRNNGQCFESPNGDFTCHCPPGFAGRTCETEIPLSQICENNFPCLNNGTCQVSGASYACICKPGFEGKDCEMNINECLSMPCLHGGTCIDGINEFKCLCGNSGYTGQMCEININECENNPCLNNGVCFDNYGGYTCQCSAGFGGQNCELKLSECASNPCPYPNSMCIDSNLSYQCICRSGYIGIPPNCTRNEPCSNVNPCLNGGTCIASDEGYSCQCLPSFTGALCENSLDNCFSQPCLNGGICTNTPGGYLCNCSAEFTGPNCELPSDPCAHHPCQNNGTCMPTTGSNGVRGFYCECADTGFEGTHCENNINDCLNENCPEGKICVDGINTFKCQDPSEALKCSPNPCKNHGTCLEGVPDQTCLCPPGWKGEFCEQDIDECENPQLCVHGICRNTNGTYQCFCTPGYSGDHCEIDFDECLSHPCFNGASCLNLINGFECVCTPGFTGKECKVNINECDSNPCKNNARCIDEIATFSCVCPEGFTGRLCEENIDDCASSPCLHGGRCIDGLNSYTCDCIETGYNGPHCEINIDECMSDPCLNGAECIDQIRDYTCNCYPGFTGKNCETDINECASNPCENNGVCTEYSSISPSSYYRNTSVYGSTNPPVEKDYSNLAGYYCSCNPGFTGSNCEIDINECESSPCKHGSCLDKFNGYSCVCEEGYEGEHCETDIDECERYKPCVHGICQDRPANYICECDSKYGGKNCSVELTGCQKNQCMNGGTCIPYLDSEIHHLFNCSCPHGYQGPTCEKDTTMFFDGDSYGIVKTNREEGYDIRLRFKTTLPDGLLALGTGSTFYILELAKGRLNLHSSLLNKWEGVFIGSHLNNSEWQQVFVNINSTHLVLAANQEQTIYPINLNEGATQSHTSFATTYLGGAMSYLRNLPHGPSIFRGCFQDVMINGQWVVLPVPANSTSISLKGVQVGCKREPQCSPNPCHSGGHCTDLWNNFSCSCERPFLGNKCQYNYTAATFGHENITDSVVTVTVDPASRRAVRAVMDISMFIRTREPYGGIFYLGSKPGTVPKLEETIIAAKLSQGELHVSIQFNGSLESYSVAGVRIDTGYNQLIQVIRNVTLIQIKINGTEFFRKTITVTGQLDLQILQLGSIHPLSDGERNFKGIIQDVQMSNGTRTMVVQFFPLPPDRDFEPPLSLGQVDIDTTRVLRGIVSDENCRSEPCMHGGVCTVTWNDFSCKCPVGYKGKQCQEMEFCQMQDCPEGSECRNLNHGYECVTNITLHNTDTNAPGLRYTLVQSEEDKGNLNLNDISIAYRSRTGGNLLFIGPDAQENYLAISVYEDQIHFDWNLGFGGEHFKIAKETNDGAWTNIWVKIQEKTITGGIIAATEELFAGGNTRYLSANASQEAWNSLLTTSNISIGGSRDVFNIFRSKYTTTTADQTNSLDNVQPPITAPDDPSLSVYQGCIGEVRIGGLLLSYFTSEELNATNTLRNHFELIAGSSLGQQLGCVLCFEEECQNGGKCKNSSVSYICDCVPGFVGEDCSTNYDECIENDCKNNSTCIDGLAKYTCECQPGWEGPLCDNDIDECASGPCQNNATCKDELAKFVCVCPPEYVGETCAQLKNITCETKPCFNGADCKDVFNPLTKDNYTCICPEGFLGSKCEMAFCDSPTTPCVNYGQCISETSEPFCNCSIGFTGKFCETNIDDCENEPCAHGGKCIDGIGSYMCNCSGTGYTGPFCNVDIDECAAMLADCGRFGECQNTEGSFYCQCVPGFCGRGCKLTDPCYTNNPCDHGSTCAPMCTDKPDYKCFCPPDYKGKNCSEAEGLQFSSSNVTDIALVVVPILGILLIAAVVSLIIFVMMARKKRATRGTYSPSNQEFSNPRLELDNVMKPPPEERLI